jgi:hypothetical protein
MVRGLYQIVYYPRLGVVRATAKRAMAKTLIQTFMCTAGAGSPDEDTAGDYTTPSSAIQLAAGRR